LIVLIGASMMEFQYDFVVIFHFDRQNL